MGFKCVLALHFYGGFQLCASKFCVYPPRVATISVRGWKIYLPKGKGAVNGLTDPLLTVRLTVTHNYWCTRCFLKGILKLRGLIVFIYPLCGSHIIFFVNEWNLLVLLLLGFQKLEIACQVDFGAVTPVYGSWWVIGVMFRPLSSSFG